MTRALTFALALVVAAPAAVRAWDTVENEHEPWRSIYITVGTQGRLNEHTLIGHDGLRAVGRHLELGLNAERLRGFELLDLANSHFYRADGDQNRRLERRLAPAPPQFAGLPDFSYAIYDWIHKNATALCPSVPPGIDTREQCHEFFGWLGAGLNSSHFGTQARELYLHLHGIALDLAARARALTERLAAHPVEALIYRDFIIEAQLEALYYEGYGQHFLQDRWSMGHMWERWHGADYASVEKLLGPQTTLARARAVGFFSGLLHGSEAIRRSHAVADLFVGVLDPMCSPEVVPSMRPLFDCPPENHVFVLPVRFRTPDGYLPRGIGDYHYLPMLEGRLDVSCQAIFVAGESRDYPRRPLPVEMQRARFADCAAQGWHDVLAALGDPSVAPLADPGQDLGLDASFAARDALSCWGNWATNEAIYQGWVEDDAHRVVDYARTTLAALPGGGAVALGVDALRHAFANVTAGITFHYLRDREGTDLARGATLPSLLGVGPGNAYVSAARPVPDWAMPRGFHEAGALPWSDPERGRDQQTIFGFFNRAHADFWCDAPERIAELRGSRGREDEPRDEARIEACTLLADRFYRGTDPRYQGVQREELRVGVFDPAAAEVPLGTPYEPLCELFGVDPGPDPELIPYELHPGYVAAPGDKVEVGHRTIEAWCTKVPLLDYLWMPGAAERDRHHWNRWRDEDRWDVVALTDTDGGPVQIPGRHLDGAGGRLWLTWVTCHQDCDMPDGGLGIAVPVEVRYQVAAGVARFELPEGLAIGDHALELAPDHGPEAVGRFRLRVIGTSLSAPIVLSLQIDPLEPGGDAYVEARVYDPDGWEDLDAERGAFVELLSEVFAHSSSGSPFLGEAVLLDSSEAESETIAIFWNGTTEPVTTPLSDRLSSCPPPEYPVLAWATDTGLSIDPEAPAPQTGPVYEGTATVQNVAPAPLYALDAAAPPGGQLDFTAAFTDDNHDGRPVCDELPAGRVEFDSHPAGLETAQSLPSLAWSVATDAPPERSFQASTTVADPHRDGTFTAEIQATDDNDPPLGALSGAVTIEVLNVAPTVIAVTTDKSALHPGESYALTVRVVAEDRNTAADLDDPGFVEVDLSGLAGGVHVVPRASPAGGARWEGQVTRRVTAPNVSGAVPIPAFAFDDDLALGLGVGGVTIANVAPVLSGVGLVWDDSGQLGTPDEGVVRACERITLGAVASDANRDALVIEVILKQGGVEIPVSLPKGSDNVYHATIDAPCQGTWTLSYTAVEVHPAGSGYTTLRSQPKTLTLTVQPALDPCACARCICHGRANGSACDDCVRCTPSSVCQAGTCVGTPRVCAQDQNPCTLAACVEADGDCKTTTLPDLTECQDGDVCTRPDRCLAGVCQPGALVSGCCRHDGQCDDSNACTSDACDEATGICANVPLGNGAPCSDGVRCTTNDQCISGICGGTPITCAPTGDVCTVARCDEADGQCKPFPANPGGACEDGDPCTVGDACSGGACVPGPRSSTCCQSDEACDDGELCTADACDEGVCVWTADHEGEGCDDGDPCTTGSTCQDKVCGGGTTLTCCGSSGGEVCTPDGPCVGNGDGRCEEGTCQPWFEARTAPPGGEVHPYQGGAAAEPTAYTSYDTFRYRHGLQSLEPGSEDCDRVGFELEMSEALLPPTADDFIDLGIWFYHPDLPGDAGPLPPLQGATHALSVSWNPDADDWQGHLWVYQSSPTGPGGAWVIADANVPFTIDGTLVSIATAIPGFDGCVPHKILAQYLPAGTATSELTWKFVTQGEDGLSAHPLNAPIACP